MKNLFKTFSLAVAIFLFLNLTAQAQNNELTALDIIRATNELRASKGIKPLIINEKLTSAATDKAQDMQNKQYFAHVDNQNNGLEKWLGLVDYNYYYAGENLALDFYQLPILMQNWEQSPKHLQNLLDPIFQETGVAVINGEFKNQPTVFVVQMFGADPYENHLTYSPSLIPIINATAQKTVWLPSLISKDGIDIISPDNQVKHYYLWDLPYRLKLTVQATDNEQTYEINKLPTPLLTYQTPSFLKNVYYYTQEKTLHVWLIVLAIITLFCSQKIKEEKK